MKFAALRFLLAASASSVLAFPASSVAADSQDLETRATTSACGVDAFNLVSLRSGSPIHQRSFSASKSALLVNLPKGKQGAICDGNPEGVATFFLKDGGLYLYHAGKGKKQQIFVDRSGMGQGVLGYMDEGQTPPRYAELQGWKSIKNGDHSYLTFKDSGLLACPGSLDKSWRVWVDIGIQNPGGNKDCLGLSAIVLPSEDPVSCRYTR